MKKYLPFILMTLLVGCASSEENELREWMQETRKETRPMVQKIPEPKKFTPYEYTDQNLIDPFNEIKLQVALSRAAAKPGGGLKPDLDRRREPLESYPLDSFKMVGTLQKPGATYALVAVDNTLFQVKQGNYIGQNFGVVIKVSESEIQLKELVQDPSGEWVERVTSLLLQENKK